MGGYTVAYAIAFGRDFIIHSKVNSTGSSCNKPIVSFGIGIFSPGNPVFLLAQSRSNNTAHYI